MKKYISIFIFLIVTLLFYLIYLNLGKSIPFSFYDEFWWVNDSYLAEYYYRGDFTSAVWNSPDAKDQPMVTRLVFAAILYPGYLTEKFKISDSFARGKFDYTKYLIQNGFYYSDTNNTLNSKETALAEKNIVKINLYDSGTSTELVTKYGKTILIPIALIKSIRSLNALLFALTTAITFFLLRRFRGILFSSAFVLLLGLNNLVVNSVLKAHSDALFFLFFVITIFVMTEYKRISSFKVIVLVSLLTSVTASIKLNGIILYPIFVIYTVISDIINRYRINLINILNTSLLSFFTVFFVFVLLNPFVYSNPFAKIYEMYKYRRDQSVLQGGLFKDSKLGNIGERVHAMYNSYFADNVLYIEKATIRRSSAREFILLIFFVFGLINEIKSAVRKDKLSLVIIISGVILFASMLLYLDLNWPRYFLPLIFPVIFLQLSGFLYILKLIDKGFFNRLSITSSSKRNN